MTFPFRSFKVTSAFATTIPLLAGIVVANADVTLKLRKGKVIEKHIDGALTDMKDYAASEDFMEHFAPQFNAVQDFVSKKIGSFTETISTRPAYFGSSAFIDLIHLLQLEITNADISLAAPLSYDTEINKGDVFVSDMFNLYKYENMLYTMKLSGKEVKDALEMSYNLWTNQMKSADDHLLLFRKQRREGATDRASFQNFSFNFDSGRLVLVARSDDLVFAAVFAGITLYILCGCKNTFVFTIDIDILNSFIPPVQLNVFSCCLFGKTIRSNVPVAACIWMFPFVDATF